MGKLTKAPMTKSQSVARSNQFIRNCESAADELFGSPELRKSLSRYFRMLGEAGAFLPRTTIRNQLARLAAVPEKLRVTAVEETISHGWKSLTYMCDKVHGAGQLNRKQLPEIEQASVQSTVVRESREQMLRRMFENC